MRRTATVLAVLLAAQLVLAAALHVVDGYGAVGGYGPPLTEFEAEAVEAIRITGSDGDTVRIKRSSQGWKLPGVSGFPAAESRVERLLSNLEDFDDKLPVARSDAARQRFSVAAEDFERRIVFLLEGDARATLYLGDSAGAGEVYARAAGHEMIYQVEFLLSNAAANAADWYDTSVAALDPDDIRKVALGGFALRRAGDNKGWRLVRDGDGADNSKSTLRASRVHQWIRRLVQPDFQAVTKAEPPKGEPALAYTVVTEDGEKIGFAYYDTGDSEESVYLYRDDQPWQYQVAADTLAKLQKLEPAKLLAPAPDDDKAGPSATKPSGAASGRQSGKSPGKQSGATSSKPTDATSGGQTGASSGQQPAGSSEAQPGSSSGKPATPSSAQPSGSTSGKQADSQAASSGSASP